mmetsp:Transcript_26649/g.47970  ORF Transcript_26649/g.47970 Transcript_26649/m.47970 type:complete len:271 (-) Transcript_26649:7-819(-)
MFLFRRSAFCFLIMAWILALLSSSSSDPCSLNIRRELTFRFSYCCWNWSYSRHSSSYFCFSFWILFLAFFSLSLMAFCSLCSSSSCIWWAMSWSCILRLLIATSLLAFSTICSRQYSSISSHLAFKSSISWLHSSTFFFSFSTKLLVHLSICRLFSRETIFSFSESSSLCPASTSRSRSSFMSSSSASSFIASMSSCCVSSSSCLMALTSSSWSRCICSEAEMWSSIRIFIFSISISIASFIWLSSALPANSSAFSSSIVWRSSSHSPSF